MRRIVLPLVAVLAAITIPTQVSAAPADARTYVVQFAPNVNASGQADVAKGLGIAITKQYSAAINGFSAQLNAGQVRGLMNNPNVESVEENVVMTADGITAIDPLHFVQTGAPWGLDRLDQRPLPLDNSFLFWNEDGKGVPVYVFDTGLSTSVLPEFASVKAGQNFVAGQDPTNTNDCNGHGTHVAGTIASNTYGIAKSANLVPIRVLDCTGAGTLTAFLAGVDWVLKQQPSSNPISLANMSLSFGVTVKSVNTAVANLMSRGILTTAAAGNSNVNACNSSPGSAASALTVGASDDGDRKAAFSNYGSCLDLFAPGVNILSLAPSGGGATATMSGTSMSAPHVAGLAAVMQSHYKYATSADLSKAVLSAASVNVMRSVGTGSPNRLAYLPNN